MRPADYRRPMLLEISKPLPGKAPPWVCDAWMGLQFRSAKPHPITMATRHAGTSEVIERQGYPVDARELLGLLALHREDAARWYIENEPQMLAPGQVFLVDEGCCFAIPHLSPVSPASPASPARAQDSSDPSDEG